MIYKSISIIGMALVLPVWHGGQSLARPATSAERYPAFESTEQLAENEISKSIAGFRRAFFDPS
jgi:hypothetical protein